MKHLKVALKLIISFSIVAVLTAVVGITGIFGMRQIENAGTYMYENVADPLPYLARVSETLQNMRVYVREMVISSLTNDMAGVEESFSIIAGLMPGMEENLNAYSKTLYEGSEARELFDQARSLYENELFATVMSIYEASQVRDVPTILAHMQVCRTLSDTILGNFDKCLDLKVDQARAASKEATDLANTLFIAIIAILGFALFAVVFLTFYVSGLIGKPLTMMSRALKHLGTTGNLECPPEVLKSAQECSSWRDEIGDCARGFGSLTQHLGNIEKTLMLMSRGDITVEVQTLSDSDNIGLSVKKLAENLNGMFGEINASTSQVDSGAKQIADGAQSLSQGSTEQAASIEQLSSSVSEIAGQTKVNAEMAEKAASLSEVIKGNAEKGNRQMDEMMEAVRDINTASQNISKVIKVIDDIAFQTNILALNAAVEAARAGQHGKGFAVVAEEVRNLAAKSAEAAKETGDMIQNSMEKAELGSRIASETAVSFTEISQGINESSQIVSEIAKSSKEQSMGISQINIGIDQVAQVVQQNSATAEESAAASEEMSGQSAMLQELISQFKLKY
ncbi:MAG: methyl-accepting chemotaxis protein [Oscillospiraceae bacterium]|nr:methyl-accepting chemotaxis protein [Oscillospiraceae bacterium]